MQRGRRWWLHTFVEKEVTNPGTVKEQVTSAPDVKVCSVKLSARDSLAVCTIQTREGTTLATRFIGGGSQLNGLRKSALDALRAVGPRPVSSRRRSTITLACGTGCVLSTSRWPTE